MKYLSLILAQMLFSICAFSQQNDYGKVWVNGVAVSFKTTFNSTQVINQYHDTVSSPSYSHGHSNICDSAGNLLLCSDGFNIYNVNNDTIDGGFKVTYDAWFNLNNQLQVFNQGSLFLPKGNSQYYFINAFPSDAELLKYSTIPGYQGGFDCILYNIVDMKANAGAGKVTKKMLPALQNTPLSITQMMACKHGDGESWWLLKQAFDTNVVYKFLFTHDTVLGPYIQNFSQPHFGKITNGGQSVFSKNGSRYATAARGSLALFVTDFDRCSGVLSNPLIFTVPALPVYYPDTNTLAGYDSLIEGVAFSPNGRYIYIATEYHIQQLDLQDANPSTQWAEIAGIDTTWAQFQNYASIHLGPDDKLYVGNWNGLSAQMSVINTPDNKGPLASFCPRCLRFPKYQFSNTLVGGGVNAPPNMPNYKLGPTSPPCWLTPVEEIEKLTAFKLYPNPANTALTFEYSEPGIVQLVDVLGRIQQSISLPANTVKHIVRTENVPAGIYTYRHIVDGKPKNTGKLVIIH